MWIEIQYVGVRKEAVTKATREFVFWISCVFLCLAASIGFADDPPLVYGVTQGSVYREFVKPKWYDADATATLSINSQTPVPFANGDKISSNGDYELTVSGAGGETRVAFAIDASAATAQINTNVDGQGTDLEIDFQSGTYEATPVFAIWTEDVHGNFIQNLYVSSMPATNIMRFTNNVLNRPQSVPYWAHKNCVEKAYGSDFLYLAEPDVPIPEDLDAVTGATQKAGFTISTKARTNAINDSRIKVFFEVNQSFDAGWYFYGANATHEEEGSGSFSSDKFFYGSEEPALVYSAEVDLDSGQTTIIGSGDDENVVQPVGYSHYAGRTATLYTDFYADDSGVERYKFDHAQQMVALLTATVYPDSVNRYIGDFDRDEDVDGADLSRLAKDAELVGLYLSEVASNFSIDSSD